MRRAAVLENHKLSLQPRGGVKVLFAGDQYHLGGMLRAGEPRSLFGTTVGKGSSLEPSTGSGLEGVRSGTSGAISDRPRNSPNQRVCVCPQRTRSRQQARPHDDPRAYSPALRPGLPTRGERIQVQARSKPAPARFRVGWGKARPGRSPTTLDASGARLPADHSEPPKLERCRRRRLLRSIVRRESNLHGAPGRHVASRA
jgi:hypothetical protein